MSRPGQTPTEPDPDWAKSRPSQIPTKPDPDRARTRPSQIPTEPDPYRARSRPGQIPTEPSRDRATTVQAFVERIGRSIGHVFTRGKHSFNKTIHVIRINKMSSSPLIIIADSARDVTAWLLRFLKQCPGSNRKRSAIDHISHLIKVFRILCQIFQEDEIVGQIRDDVIGLFGESIAEDISGDAAGGPLIVRQRRRLCARRRLAATAGRQAFRPGDVGADLDLYHGTKMRPSRWRPRKRCSPDLD